MIGRPPSQGARYLVRDVKWLTRIRKRARDAEEREAEIYHGVLERLDWVLARFKEEIEGKGGARG